VKTDLRVSKGKVTVAKILDVATKLFSEKGYANTSTEEIVNLAGVTRGAFYHHFASKEALFLAVFERTQRKIRDRILRDTAATSDPWEALVKGNYSFLKTYTDPEFRQIVAIDAPSVLDWEVYREIDWRYSTSTLKNVLKRLRDAGVTKPLSVETLTHAIAGATNELALWIAEAKDPKRALAKAQEICETMYNSLRNDTR
jgi:AcrR family transcriptional regulator